MANCEASANSQAAMLRLKDELSDDEKNGNIGNLSRTLQIFVRLDGLFARLIIILASLVRLVGI